jgi:hypothetical protein
VLLAANFASGRTRSEGLWATGAAAELLVGVSSATAGSLLPASSGLDGWSSILCLFRLPLELPCSGSTARRGGVCMDVEEASVEPPAPVDGGKGLAASVCGFLGILLLRCWGR